MSSDRFSLEPDETQPPDVGAPINVRSVSLAVLATAAVIFLLHWAKVVLIPIALAVFLRYALMPIVTWLTSIRIPIALGAALVLALVVGALVIGMSSVHDDALDMLDKLPRAAQKFELAIRKTARNQMGALGRLKTAATQIDKAATAAIGPPAGEVSAPKAPMANIPPISTIFLSGSLGLAGGIGQAILVMALAYFLLIEGDTFKRKIVRISGDTLSKKKITVKILQEIDNQIQRYWFVQIGSSVLLGILAWIILTLIGLENAALWGLVAGVLHLIPYVGPIVAILLTGVAAYLQFPDMTSVFGVVGGLSLITGLIGFGLVPALTAKIGNINAVTVFIALLVWGWLWGVWGLLLGVPIVMAIHAVCERIPELGAVAELLGSEPQKASAPETAHAKPESSDTRATNVERVEPKEDIAVVLAREL